jgi:hypothetical protein
MILAVDELEPRRRHSTVCIPSTGTYSTLVPAYERVSWVFCSSVHLSCASEVNLQGGREQCTKVFARVPLSLDDEPFGGLVNMSAARFVQS